MDYNKNQPILEIYKAIQSEGSLNGIPHIIVRTTGCTHRCWFGEGGWCDSWYTSIHPEKGKYTLNNIKQYFEENKYINYLMLTGGSPTMHAELCNEIITLFKEIHGFKSHPDIDTLSDQKVKWIEDKNQSNGIVTIETEGSHFIQTKYKIDLISLSPKFGNSIPQLGILTPQGNIVDQKMIDQHNKFRLKLDIMKQMIDYHKDYQYKPVWDGTEEKLQEIEEFRIKMDIPKNKTWIMPGGDNRETLIKMYPIVINMCAEKGYNFSGRDHIIAFEQQREV
jgi:7-carboxy-7-deazaguanine synthase